MGLKLLRWEDQVYVRHIPLSLLNPSEHPIKASKIARMKKRPSHTRKQVRVIVVDNIGPRCEKRYKCTKSEEEKNPLKGDPDDEPEYYVPIGHVKYDPKPRRMFVAALDRNRELTIRVAALDDQYRGFHVTEEHEKVWNSQQYLEYSPETAKMIDFLDYFNYQIPPMEDNIRCFIYAYIVDDDEEE